MGQLCPLTVSGRRLLSDLLLHSDSSLQGDYVRHCLCGLWMAWAVGPLSVRIPIKLLRNAASLAPLPPGLLSLRRWDSWCLHHVSFAHTGSRRQIPLNHTQGHETVLWVFLGDQVLPEAPTWWKG